MSTRRKRRAVCVDKPEYLTKCEQICEQLRELQWKTNCSTKTLQHVLDSLRGKLGRLVKECDDLPKQTTYADKKMQEMVTTIIYKSNKNLHLNPTTVFVGWAEGGAPT